MKKFDRGGMCEDKVLLNGEISSIASEADSLRTELDDENSFVNEVSILVDTWSEVASNEKSFK